jgi:hypothetical protein
MPGGSGKMEGFSCAQTSKLSSQQKPIPLLIELLKHRNDELTDVLVSIAFLK